jgi:hypothetical protein
MEPAVDLLERVDATDDGWVDADELMRALLELAESAERNQQLSRTEADDGWTHEAA